MTSIPLTRAQVREVDRIAVEELGIPGAVLMENAGRGAARIILDEASEGGLVSIVCGCGNNGGDGFVIARHLANAGQRVAVFLACDPSKLSGDAATNYHIVSRMGIDFIPFETEDRIHAGRVRLHESEIIVDAILGTGFSGQIRAPLDAAISAINSAAGVDVIAIDVPSGLDCDSGAPSNPTVKAQRTITFVAPKQGFGIGGAPEFVGRLHVVGIGTPPALIRRVRQQIK